MYKSFLQNNSLTASIALFVIVFFVIQYAKPVFLYKEDGSMREFGVGYRNKTILPVWLLAIVLGILSYVAVKFLIITL